jgi:hypothetical protein
VLDERRKQTPPTLAHELNERLQEEAFLQFDSRGFFPPHDLYSNGRFSAGTEPDPVDDTKDIHPTPKKSTRTSLLKG